LDEPGGLKTEKPFRGEIFSKSLFPSANVSAAFQPQQGVRLSLFACGHHSCLFGCVIEFINMLAGRPSFPPRFFLYALSRTSRFRTSKNKSVELKTSSHWIVGGYLQNGVQQREIWQRQIFELACISK